jgi:hypothetical protein
MKQINLSCSCGATAEFIDQCGTYINKEGDRTENGLMFLIDLQAEEWLELHSKCGKKEDSAKLDAVIEHQKQQDQLVLGLSDRFEESKDYVKNAIAKLNGTFAEGLIQQKEQFAEGLIQQKEQFAFHQNKDKMRIWVSVVNSYLSCQSHVPKAVSAADAVLKELELRFNI